MTWNFPDMEIRVPWDHLWNKKYPHWSNLTSFVMTYHDHGHPIKTNIYNSVEIWYIELKFWEYDHMGVEVKSKLI